MVWQEHVTQIVMLTNIYEDGQVSTIKQCIASYVSWFSCIEDESTYFVICKLHIFLNHAL